MKPGVKGYGFVKMPLGLSFKLDSGHFVWGGSQQFLICQYNIELDHGTSEVRITTLSLN